MYYTSIMNHTENLKIIKKALAEKYGYKNISVRNGSGTAWGWVEVSITVEGATEGVEKEAEAIIHNTGVKLYTYSRDYGDDGECLLIGVHSK